MADIVGIMQLAIFGLIAIFLLFSLSGALLAKNRIEGFLSGGVVFVLVLSVILFSTGKSSQKQTEVAEEIFERGQLGCSNPPFVAYEKALLTGSVHDIEIAVDGIVNYRIEDLRKKSGGYFLQGEKPTREGIIKKLVTTGLGYCTRGRDALLLAVLAGNIETTQWLLEQGTDPRGLEPSTNPGFPSENIFSRCGDRPVAWNKFPFDDENVRMRRLETYALVIKAGATPDMPLKATKASGHLTAMDVCKDKLLLELFRKQIEANSPRRAQ